MKMAILLMTFVFISLCIQSEPENHFVSKVIDGDTIELENGEKVRLIGIDSTEIGEECHDEATEKLGELILNKNIRLEKDVRYYDDYDRTLGYVYSGDMFVNFEMVRGGYAYALTIEPNIEHSEELENAEAYAERNSIGCLWAK